MERLDANAGFTDALAPAAGTLSTAATKLAVLKDSGEISATRNETAATAQERVSHSNERVSTRLTEVVAHFERFQVGMELSAKVVGSMGTPMQELHQVLGSLPEIVRDIEGSRESGDNKRDENMRQATSELANMVGKAVERLGGYATVAKSLEVAADRLGQATESLEGFALHIDSGVDAQQGAATAAADTAKANTRVAPFLPDCGATTSPLGSLPGPVYLSVCFLLL